MFGDKVTQRVRQQYADAYFTAHFEVPGEMFLLALEAQVGALTTDIVALNSVVECWTWRSGLDI